MIGLHTGARVGEVAQLKVADVERDQGVWCFKIRITRNRDASITQGLKGKSSIRTIPIAQGLLDAGFLDFVDDARRAGHERLFPHLKLGTKQGSAENNGDGYGAALCRQFTDHLKCRHGMESGLAFHCFRHRLINHLLENNVKRKTVASITGHGTVIDEEEEGGSRAMRVSYEKRGAPKPPPPGFRAEQARVLADYPPPIMLPRYTKGQFDHCYGGKAKLYI